MKERGWMRWSGFGSTDEDRKAVIKKESLVLKALMETLTNLTPRIDYTLEVDDYRAMLTGKDKTCEFVMMVRYRSSEATGVTLSHEGNYRAGLPRLGRHFPIDFHTMRVRHPATMARIICERVDAVKGIRKADANRKSVGRDVAKKVEALLASDGFLCRKQTDTHRSEVQISIFDGEKEPLVDCFVQGDGTMRLSRINMPEATIDNIMQVAKALKMLKDAGALVLHDDLDIFDESDE